VHRGQKGVGGRGASKGQKKVEAAKGWEARGQLEVRKSEGQKGVGGQGEQVEGRKKKLRLKRGGRPSKLEAGIFRQLSSFLSLNMLHIKEALPLFTWISK